MEATTRLPGIETQFRDELSVREERAERFTCVLWISVICLTYVFFLLETEFSERLRRDIGLLVAVTVPSFLLIYVSIKRLGYHPAFAYINTLLQLTVVSGAIYFDIQAYGTQYALSSMPPLAYGLVIIVTAFRLRPLVGIFAGVVAAAQFLLIYALASRPSGELTPELLSRIPSLDWEVTMMKAVVLIGLGVAGSFSAWSLRKELYNFIDRAGAEMRLHHSLGRYVSPEIADALRGGNDWLLEPHLTRVVIMFGDIRNFTRFSNSHSPEEVANLVNDFFDKADSAIRENGGVLNKFLGDGFMAIFGLEDEAGDAREGAVRAGLAILERNLARLEEKDLDLGIAINHGEVVAGEIGSAGRCEFTVLGNAVNIAARLEGMNRKLSTRCLVTRDFAEELPEGLVQIRSLGLHDIRGIADSIELVELRAD